MEGAHGSDVSALVGSSFASGDGVAVDGDAVEVKFLLTSEEATEGDQSVTKGVKHPLFSCAPCCCGTPVVGVRCST